MRQALVALLVALAIAGAGCGGDEPARTTAAEVVVTTAALSSSSTAVTTSSMTSATGTVTLPLAGWEVHTPDVEVPPPVEGRGDIVFPPPQLRQVAVVGNGFVGVGRGQEGFAAWQSRDGFDWDLTFYEAFSPRGDSDRLHLWGGELLLVGEHRLVAVGTISTGRQAPVPNLSPVTAVWLSDDAGASWRRGDWPEQGASLVYDVASTSLGLVAVGDVRPNEPEPGPINPAIWISRDAGQSWERVGRTGEAFTGEGGVVRVVEFAGGLLAVGSIDDRVGVWQSADGESWVRSGPEVFGDAGCTVDSCYVGGWAGGLAALDGKAVAFTALRDLETGTYPLSLWESPDGVEWTRWPGDPAWGDGEDCRLGDEAVWRDRLVAWGTITERTDPQFCFQDPSTCDTRSIVVNLGDSGGWQRLSLDPLPDSLIADLAVGPDLLLIVTEGAEDGDPPQRVYLWEGTPAAEPQAAPVTAPTTTVPPYPVLDASIDTLELGVTWRYVYAFQGCWGDSLHFNGRTWKRVEEIPIDPEWPVRPIFMIDAPTELLYGTITLVTPDRIEIRVENGDLVAVFTPTEEEAPMCW